MNECPCGSGKTYDNCCEPIIKGTRDAETAEELMRSRYSAYVKTEIDYIFESTHPDKRNELDREGTTDWSEKSTWHGLEIISTGQGCPDDEVGTVEFIAHFSHKGNRQKQHELSSFKKVNGKWIFYESEGVAPKQFKRSEPKVGRNSPCPCGSGKKFKKCCGR